MPMVLHQMLLYQKSQRRILRRKRKSFYAGEQDGQVIDFTTNTKHLKTNQVAREDLNQGPTLYNITDS